MESANTKNGGSVDKIHEEVTTPKASSTTGSALSILSSKCFEPPDRERTFRASLPPTPPSWPLTIRYLTRPEHSPKLTTEQLQFLNTHPKANLDGNAPVYSTIRLPLESSRYVRILPITDANHPANNQCGLFATTHLLPDSLIIPYFGLVHSNDANDTDETSNYDLSLNREADLSVDANTMGNEARMTNDYRGVPRPMTDSTRLENKKGQKPGPNAEFRDVWFEYMDKNGKDVGELGIAIFVLGAGKSGKRKAGIKAGEEVLVNYGKGFWKDRMIE